MQYVRDGHAELVPAPEIFQNAFDKMLYYVPHHAVYRNDKITSKIRIVFDCSSKAPGKLSLNDHIVQGPNLNPDLVSIFLNFRTFKIALCADIEKAFL